MTKKITQLLIAFISAILLFGCQSKEMKKAKEFMEASMYDQAISLLKIEIQDNPKNAEANFLLGKCYIETSKNSKVEDYFNRAILLNTDYKEKVGNIYFDKSLELYQNNNFRYADSYYEEGIKYNPTYKDEFAKKLFGYINKYSKTTTETDKPITIYKIVNNISPNFKIKTSENTFNLAKLFIEKGFIKEGFKYADFSIQYDSKHIKDVADIYFNHGKNLLTIQNKPNESIYYFDRCLQLNPQRKSEIGNIYYNQAKVFEANNNIKLLMVFAQKSAEINPDYNKWYLEIKEKYKPKIPLGNLVAYYPFNGNANDESGNRNNGHIYGASLTYDREGNPNSAYYFDGMNDFLEVRNPFDFNRAFSFSGWFYVDPSSQGWNSFFTKSEYCDFGIMYFDSNKYGGPLIRVFNGTCEGIRSNDLKKKLPTSRWFHFSFTYDGNKIKIFIDGILVNSFYYSNVINDGHNLYIGASFNRNYFWHGSIDDVRIYSRALSEDEISLLFQEN